MPDFTIKEGDLLPPIEATLSDRDGPINLTGATVELVAENDDRTTTITGAAAIVGDPTAGAVRYDPVAGETDVPGYYDLEFKVTKGGKPIHVPNDRYFRLLITPKLG